ncbi:hypothetical protein ES705_39863 [subsurface metagenome]
MAPQLSKQSPNGIRRKFAKAKISLLAMLVVSMIVMGSGLDVFAEVPAELFTPGRSFSLNDNIVTAVVFSWYTPTGGQVSGPWRPEEGRINWTGEVDFWKRQIKDVMSANIDVIHVMTCPNFPNFVMTYPNMLTAARQLRAEGYQTPQMAPFLDTSIIWSYPIRPPADLSTAAGKDAYVNEYKTFFDQYFATNTTNPYADSNLCTIDGKPVLDTYAFPSQLSNADSLSRSDVESRLASEYGAEHPSFNNGIYMTGNHELDWQDESFVQYGSNSHHSKRTFNDRKVITVKPGYWDQNVRSPGTFLSRDGGDNYRDAWQYVQDVKDGGWFVDGEFYAQPVHRVAIESWNEYDEGSGIYAANPGEPYFPPSNTGDTWSNTNDPREYIKTTAEGARQFNDTPDRNASILRHNMPSEMTAGETRTVKVVVRNEGDLAWTGADDFRFGQKDFIDPVLFGPTRYLIDDASNEIPEYGGVFRGRPIMFEFDLIAPSTEGDYLTHWGMLQENVTWFGEELVLPITVVPETATLGLLLIGGLTLLHRRRK